MTLDNLRFYLTPSTYCMVIDVTDHDHKKELFKGSSEKMVRFRDQLRPEHYHIWTVSVDKQRGWLSISVYKKGSKS